MPNRTRTQRPDLRAADTITDDAIERPLANVPARDGGAVQIDLTAVIDGCSTAIMERHRDGSPPMVALSADVVRAVAEFARTLSRGIAEAKSPGEALRWQEFAAEGPSVGGDGAADAWGSVVHPIHVSAVRSNVAQNSEPDESFVIVTDIGQMTEPEFHAFTERSLDLPEGRAGLSKVNIYPRSRREIFDHLDKLLEYQAGAVNRPPKSTPADHLPIMARDLSRILRCTCGWRPAHGPIDSDTVFTEHLVISRSVSAERLDPE